MSVTRMENVGIVVEDLAATVAFFVELGLELEGEMTVDGSWAARIWGLDEVEIDVAMVRTPDGTSKLELMRFHTPTAIPSDPTTPANTMGIRRLLFTVEDVDDTIARLRPHGAELVGEVQQIGDAFRMCYLRGPEGIIVALAEELGPGR
jgi:catechol 2,3-dioxygenase-like lactoylglutathione lyase family enzyme